LFLALEQAAVSAIDSPAIYLKFQSVAMPPLILHNVPDDELYVGDDGVQRPYAIVFPG
jgi:hypothetical protein